MSNPHHYPKGTVTALLQTDAVNAFTKKILLGRMAPEEKTDPLFFEESEFKLLTLVCDLLMAQKSNERICNPAIAIDQRLTNNNTDGWRYDHLPPDGEAYKIGLSGIEETATKLFQQPFEELAINDQLQLLQLLQQGEVTTPTWQTLHPYIFFEELLAEVTAIFYSHPLVQEEIGFVGMADANGWMKIGPDEKEAIEPDEINATKFK